VIFRIFFCRSEELNKLQIAYDIKVEIVYEDGKTFYLPLPKTTLMGSSDKKLVFKALRLIF